jgi:hypothetical protein
MSVVELKEKINHQIDLLTEPQDLEDLYETICLFFDNRQVMTNYSLEFLNDIEIRSKAAQEGNVKGIDTHQLKDKMKQWLRNVYEIN